MNTQFLYAVNMTQTSHSTSYAVRFWRILFLGLLCITWSEALFSDRKLPCDYHDSVNISAGIHHLNNSIIFNGIEYLEKDYAEINFILKDGNKPAIVDPYARGCPCNIKSCIRLCCPYGSIVDGLNFIDHKQEIHCRDHEAGSNFESEVIHGDNETKVLQLDQHFAYVDRACTNHFFAGNFNVTHVIFTIQINRI